MKKKLALGVILKHMLHYHNKYSEVIEVNLKNKLIFFSKTDIVVFYDHTECTY